jgi:hypothetical protein
VPFSVVDIHGRHCGIPDNTEVSDGVHLLVPFASCASAACAQALRELRLPNLQRLARRLAVEHTDAGDPASLSPPHERALARAWGLQSADGLVPLAAWQVQQAGGHAGDAGWAWITPAHLEVGRDHIDMAPPRHLQLEAQDSRTLLAAMEPYFAEDGITLAYDAPLRWLARGDLFRTLPTASLDRVIGRDIEGWMPAGDAGRPLRRLQQEMQMLLYTLPLNDARERAGLPAVNTFWASGSGALPADPPVTAPAGLQMAPDLRDAALAGDAPAWAAAWQQLDAGHCARLLAALDAGEEVRLTLCGEAGSRTWSSRAAGAWQRLTGWLGSPTPATLLEGL